jgi:hypothetical protein
VLTMVRGRTVVKDGVLAIGPPSGEHVARALP